jgi:hypothetical protein
LVITYKLSGLITNFFTLLLTKCRVGNEPPNIKTEVVIMCSLIRAISYFGSVDRWVWSSDGVAIVWGKPKKL